MRRILEEDLGYLSSEVDAMEPQIAAVVIDKKLPRPLNGMPTSWKRDDIDSYTTFSFINPIKDAVKNVASNFFKFSKILVQAVMKISPFLVPIVAILVVGPSIIQSLPAITNTIQQTLSKKVTSNTPPEPFNFLLPKKITAKSSSSTSTQSIESTFDDLSSSITQPSKASRRKIQPIIKKIGKVADSKDSTPSEPQNPEKVAPQSSTKIDFVTLQRVTSLTLADRIAILKHVVLGFGDSS